MKYMSHYKIEPMVYYSDERTPGLYVRSTDTNRALLPIMKIYNAKFKQYHIVDDSFSVLEHRDTGRTIIDGSQGDTTDRAFAVIVVQAKLGEDPQFDVQSKSTARILMSGTVPLNQSGTAFQYMYVLALMKQGDTVCVLQQSTKNRRKQLHTYTLNGESLQGSVQDVVHKDVILDRDLYDVL